MATSLSNVQLRQQLAPAIIPASDPRSSYRNWARSYASTPLTAFQPTTEEQCAAILRLAALEGRVVRAVGSGHSPSDLPCTSDFMIRMDKMNKLIEVCTLFFVHYQHFFAVSGIRQGLTDQFFLTVGISVSRPVSFLIASPKHQKQIPQYA